MILLPQRLYESPEVSIILRQGNTCILSKNLNEPALNREGYAANHVVSVILAGEQLIRTYDDQTIRVKEGEILFIPRGIYYISDLLPGEGPFSSILFYFDDRLVAQFLSESDLKEFNRSSVPSHLQFRLSAPIELFIHSLINIYDNHGIKNPQFLDLKMLEMLHLLNQMAGKQRFADFLFQLSLPKKRNIRSFMEKNFNKPLKIEDYAYLTGRSVSTFRRDFKHYFQLTPQKWLKERRLDMALAILQEREMPVSELAMEVGYEHVSHFIREFKKKIGMSPKQFQLEKYRDRF
ncbi:MAG: AraC family transcriptional regulator [Saprospiraceae bacterium]|nr:helix-turn-helix transcriptional regulator [Lewinella sp.]